MAGMEGWTEAIKRARWRGGEIMMDKNREEFESEYSKVMGTPVTVLRILRDSESYKETEGDRLSLSWTMWQASRKAIEVDLPTEMTREIDYVAGFNQCLSECAEAITSLGIRVKGNEE